LSEVAVRGSKAGVIEQKHETKKRVFRRKRLLKVEKSTFWLSFFALEKSKDIKNGKDFCFILD
jgi:hypothetical protein